MYSLDECDAIDGRVELVARHILGQSLALANRRTPRPFPARLCLVVNGGSNLRPASTTAAYSGAHLCPRVCEEALIRL